MTTKIGYASARSAATNSDFDGVQVGCAAYYGGKLLALGWNTNRTSPIQAHYNKFRGFDGNQFRSSLHAEMMVVSKIRYLDIDFSKVDIYIWRSSPDGTRRLARPCEACEAALRKLGIHRIYYTGNNSYIREIW